MPTPTLLIVTGHPATGKTTMAGALAADLGMPVLSKDMLKETMFDAIGWSDRSWSRQLGVASIALLYRIAESLLAARASLIIESNFRPDLDNARMRGLQGRHAFHPVQVRCVASGEVMARRYLDRIAAGQRHPGHCETVDEAWLAMIRALGHAPPLDLTGPLLTVDTTDPRAVDFATIAGWARAQLATPGTAEQAHHP